MANSVQVSALTAATNITSGVTDSSDTTTGNSVAVQNTGTQVVYIGGPGVTTGTGYPLAAGSQIGMDLAAGEDLYGIVAAGSVTVAVLRCK